jgi:hypothetical protein
MVTTRSFFLFVLVMTTSCGAPAAPPVEMPIYVTTEQQAIAEAFVRDLPSALAAGVRVVPDPAATVAEAGEGTTRIALVADASLGAESYRLETAAEGFVVRGGVPLGVQYGLAHLLEAMDVRFFHPQESFVPAALRTPDPSIFGAVVTPEIDQRGLHLHTIHPIEAYFDFWEPSEAHLRDAERTIDWLVKNGGNYLTYPGLNDVIPEGAVRDAWLEHSRAIIEYAHMRGVRMGMGIQIFAGASLQRAFVLVPTGTTDLRPVVEERLSILAMLPLDSIQLSFGEFSGEDPDAFIAAIDLVYDAVQRVLPGATVTATVHVGNYASTRVTYMGEMILYYFLVRFATPEVVPWIHTTMYFDLFESAAGAYGHEEFDEHREYLFDRLEAGQPVGYHPETAYWVAFDNSVPLYLPLYMRNRMLDLRMIRARALANGHADLEDHVVFSSGWEWGYWQNDWTVLRTSFHLPATDGELLHDMLDPLPHGADMVPIVSDLIEVQRRAFIDERLSGYTGGRDATFRLGELMGVYSQPLRVSIDAVHAMTPTDRMGYRTTVAEPLARLATDCMALEARVDALGIDPNDRWLSEIADGVEIDRLRAQHAAALASATADYGDGLDVAPSLAAMEALEAEAAVVVARRLAGFHDPDGDELVADDRPSALLYQYGYLREANELCFWRRDRIELGNASGVTDLRVPGCVL